jgi:tripartite-type tricarboxylate transporter receptor subunit TctC
MRKLTFLAAGFAATLACIGAAGAQVYPSRPVTIIVPFAAGGGTDAIGRVVSERMKASLGQPVIVENVTGAAGNIGVGRVARAAPDGYTLVMGIWNTQVANGALYSLPYDLMKDFEPIALITDTPLLIVAKKTMPANDLKSLIAWLKANPDKASAATAGVGSAEHITGVLFQNITGTHFQFVPYRGSAPAMQDLMGGQIDMMFSPSTPSLPQIRSGNIKAYAVTSKVRLASAPDIPTVGEAGLPGLYFSVWTSLWAPKGTAKEIITKLSAAVVEALADPPTRTKLANMGPIIVPREQQTSEALGALQRAEVEKWWPIIRAANIKGE